MSSAPFDQAEATARRVSERTGCDRHDVLVVLGSGWAPAANQLGPADCEMSFAELGGFPPVAVAGHAGVMRSVSVAGWRVLVQLGRVHLYEGHQPAEVVHGVRAAIMAGCSVVALTNAAGGLRPDESVGDAVLIRDHLNLTGRSPLSDTPTAGPYATRFVDMTDAYSPRLRALIRSVDPGIA